MKGQEDGHTYHMAAASHLKIGFYENSLAFVPREHPKQSLLLN